MPLSLTEPRIIVALDFDTEVEALALAKQLDPKWCRLKIGIGMFTRWGCKLVEKLQQQGFEIFLDLKFHDIPHQVALACQAAAELGVWMVNVHGLGGREMLLAARSGLDKCLSHKPLLIAVTVLTSMVEADLQEIGISESVSTQVLQLAQLTQDAGLDGVVCSGKELPLLRERFGQNFCLVTPGIRPSENAKNDQKRVLTPRSAIDLGADYLVIGRPITTAYEPIKILKDIVAEIS